MGIDPQQVLAYALSAAAADVECSATPMHRYRSSERRIYSLAGLGKEDKAFLDVPVSLLVWAGRARQDGDEVEILYPHPPLTPAAQDFELTAA